MLTVVHEGATMSTHVLVLSTQKLKKNHWAGRPYENPYLHKLYKSTSTNKIHGIIFPRRNARTPGTKSSTRRYGRHYCRTPP